jgi:hypothetical protein
MLKNLNSEAITSFSNDFNKKGLRSSDGEILIQPKYDSLINVYSKHVWAKTGGHWKIINLLDEDIFILNQGCPNGFCDGISRVEVNGKFGYVSINGEWITEPVYDDVEHFNLKIGFLKKNGLWALVSDQGVIRTAFEFEKTLILDENRILVSKGNKFYEISKTGVELRKLPYDDVDDFERLPNSFLKVCLNQMWGIADRNWNVISSCKYPLLGFCESGFAVVKNAKGKYGFVNKFGRLVIPFLFDDASSFFNKVAIVSRKGKYGAISSSGKIVIPMKYDHLMDEYAQIYAEKEDCFFYINHRGKLIKDLPSDKLDNYGNYDW